MFSILNVSKGFWHVLLDEPSSFLTTFHTPFGRYRWRRMPFGICSAPEVFQHHMHELITATSSKSKISRHEAVCKAFRAMFARYGVPDVLVTDNGPQFASSEFSEFAKMWGFDHVTSSPRYLQSNGKGENAVKTVKRLFKKYQESGESEYVALLDWRNTPTEGFGTSPAQRFLGRGCKTRLPTQRSLLVPRYSTERDAEALQS